MWKSVANAIAKLCAAAALISIVAGCGSTGPLAGKQLSPAFVAAGTTALVATTLRNSPNTSAEIGLASTILCTASGGTNISPQSVHDSLSAQNFNLTTVALLNGIQVLFTQAVESGSQYTARDYANAIFCVGIPNGIGQLPAKPAARGGPLPPGTLPPVPTGPPSDPRFPLWEK